MSPACLAPRWNNYQGQEEVALSDLGLTVKKLSGLEIIQTKPGRENA